MTDATWTPDRIRALRKTLGWTQEQAAREIGVSHSTWARWEIGERTPTSHAAISGLQNLAKISGDERAT